MESLLMLVTFGDMIGVPIMPRITGFGCFRMSSAASTAGSGGCFASASSATTTSTTFTEFDTRPLKGRKRRSL